MQLWHQGTIFTPTITHSILPQLLCLSPCLNISSLVVKVHTRADPVIFYLHWMILTASCVNAHLKHWEQQKTHAISAAVDLSGPCHCVLHSAFVSAGGVPEWILTKTPRSAHRGRKTGRGHFPKHSFLPLSFPPAALCVIPDVWSWKMLVPEWVSQKRPESRSSSVKSSVLGA